jgi:Zn-finger nucleic acid-binding protein
MELSVRHGHYVCRHCGTFHFPDRVDVQGIRVVGPSDPPLSCPICETALALAMVDREPVDYCGSCRGMLVPRASFAEIVRRRRSWAEGPPVIPTPPDPGEMRRRLTCPRCGAPFTVDHYYGPGNVVIDRCIPCDRVWLDSGELKQIVDAPGADRGSRDPT